MRSLGLLVLLFGLAAPLVRGVASESVSYEVRAYIDTSDLLILRGSTLQWQHDNTGAAVGRHGGLNYPTIITTILNGLLLQTTNWLPAWPLPPPDQIRFDASSSIFSNLAAWAPHEFLGFGAIVLGGRGSVTVLQQPSVANDSTAIIRFADGESGAEWLHVLITFQQPPEPGPLLELRFNEAGSRSVSSGVETNVAVLRNAGGTATDLHTSDALGVSGLPGDRAFDNTSSTGMGSVGTGGKTWFEDPDAVDALVSFTLQGWFYTATTADNRARLFDKQVGGKSFVLLAEDGGELTLEVNSAYTSSRQDYAATNRWVFFAVTYDSTVNQVRFYQGTQAEAVTLTDEDSLAAGIAEANSAALNIGNAAGVDRPFRGWLDNMRVFGSNTDGRGALNVAQLEWLRRKDTDNLVGVTDLAIEMTGAGFELRWPVYPRGFSLEVTDKIGLSNHWQALRLLPRLSGGANVASLDFTNPSSFFRLAPDIYPTSPP